ncbi:MAG TPA: hypothetical protein VF250_00445, partial [Conexibacter sp.]
MTRQRRRRTRTRRDSGLERPAGNRADLLHTTLLATVEDTRVTGLPHLALLHGETGRGKSYVVQALYDELCRRQPGYWLPGLKPSWPPPSLATLREQRKRIAPPDELRQPGAAASFLWIAVSCSGYWDAPRLDPTADLLRQLQRALAETVDATLAAARRRRDWVVDRVVEGIGQLEPIVGAAKFAIDTLVQAPEALRHGEPTPLAAERQRTFEALTRYARLLDALELEPPTLVVTVDDAGAAPVDLLGALAACVAEPADTESDLSEETRLLPRVLDQMPPLPVLFVLTAWDHMLPPKDDAQPLAQWLAEYEQLGLERETLRCREIQPTEAKGLLDRWTLGPDEAMRDQIVSHIASNSAHSLVNPLVLAEHVAWVEERRDPFSGEVAVTSDEIDALSTSPDHHVEERLERLRRSDDGPAVHSVLATLCSLGITLPWGLVEELLAASGAGLTVDRLQERLVRLSAVLTQQPPDPLRLFVLDADLYDHLHRRHQLTSVQQDACATACAAFLRRWIEELEPDSMLRGVSDHWSLTRMQRMAPIAVRALERIDDADTVAVLVRTLAGGEPPALGDVPGPRSAVVVVWLASDRPDEVSTSDLLAGCQELGASRIALSCLLALARERGAMLGEPELEQIVDRLAPHVEIADVQTVLVSLLCDRGHALRAQRLLEGVPLAPQSVLQLAQALELGGSPSAALALLSAHSDGNGTLIRRHATLLERIGQPDAALALLEARPETWQLSRLRAEILGRIGRDDDRGALLEQWTDRNADAARLLAADRAAAGRIDAARQLLEPWRRSWMPAAVQAARLEWADGRYIAALQALAPFLDRGGPAEATLAQMLDEIGREGMRFQLGPGGRVESVVRTQVGGAAKPRSRRERPRPAAEIRAEVVRELET